MFKENFIKNFSYLFILNRRLENRVLNGHRDILNNRVASLLKRQKN